MRMYEYFVAYSYNVDNDHYVANATIYHIKKIKTGEDILYLQKFLENEIEGAKNVTISNFILLGRRKCQ